MVFFSLVFINFLLACFVDKDPRENKYPRTDKDCPETYASFLSKVTFHWFTPIVWNGFKKPLQEKDLWNLRPEDYSKEIMLTFEYHWNQTVRSNKIKKKPSSVLPAIWKSFKFAFLMASLYELIQICFIFASPTLLKLLITFVQSKYSENKEPLWKGISYVILLFACAAMQTLLSSNYFKTTITNGVRIRTAVVDSIYRKYLVLSNRARKESTVGEIINLMAVDAERFLYMSNHITMFWSGPLQITVCVYFLWGVIGPSVCAGLVIMLLMIPINLWTANSSKKLQIRQMAYKDKRIRMMNEILNGIKVLKLYAWEPSFEETITSMRGRELDTLKKKAYLTAGIYFAWTSAPLFVALASFATFVLVDDSNVLDTQTAFVALSLFNILKRPMSNLPLMVSRFIQTLVSIKRINKFMNNEELDVDNVQHNPKHGKITLSF